MLSSRLFLLLVALLCCLSLSSAQATNVSVGSQYSAVASSGLPALLTQTSSQPVLFFAGNSTANSTCAGYEYDGYCYDYYYNYYYYGALAVAQVKSVVAPTHCPAPLRHSDTIGCRFSPSAR